MSLVCVTDEGRSVMFDCFAEFGVGDMYRLKETLKCLPWHYAVPCISLWYAADCSVVHATEG